MNAPFTTALSEVLDNSIDEHLAGHGKNIEVTVHVDGSISIRDEGRGIPVDMHPVYKIPGVEMVLTTLPFRQASTARAVTFFPAARTGSAPSVSTPYPSGSRSRSRATARSTTWNFSRGKRLRSLDVIGKSKSTGTLITFKPDPEIFKETVEFKKELVVGRLRELAFLNPGLELVFTDERGGRFGTGAFLLQGWHRGIRQAAEQEQAGRASEAGAHLTGKGSRHFGQ